jgi:cytosine/adenosine deaminase-related metal-dependent hydrolase
MEFRKRAIRTDGRTITEIATVKPSDYDYTGVVLPTLEDAHTHLADRKLKVQPGTPIGEVVRPPEGLKHRYLKDAPAQEIEASLKEGMEDLLRGGATRTHEFREGGIAGVRSFGKALRQLPPGRREHFDPLVLGRPGTQTTRPSDEQEFWQKLRRLLAECDGLGLSAISDGDAGWNIELARFARSQGKVVEVHCSESAHEPVSTVLEAGAQQVVHMVHGTREDFQQLASRGIPVAVCTRSNEFFGLRAPVEVMVECEVDIRLGTDNAFLGAPDMFEEARAFARVHKARAHVSPFQILRAIVAKKGINEGGVIAPRENQSPDFLIVDIQTERPERDLIARAKRDDVLAIVGVQRRSS